MFIEDLNTAPRQDYGKLSFCENIEKTTCISLIPTYADCRSVAHLRPMIRSQAVKIFNDY